MPTPTLRQWNRKATHARPKVRTASRQHVLEEDEEHGVEDYIHQDTYSSYELRAFSRRQIINILQHRNVDVSKIRDRKRSLISKLNELLEEEASSKNIINPSSGRHPQTRHAKKLKSMEMNRVANNNF